MKQVLFSILLILLGLTRLVSFPIPAYARTGVIGNPGSKDRLQYWIPAPHFREDKFRGNDTTIELSNNFYLSCV